MNSTLRPKMTAAKKERYHFRLEFADEGEMQVHEYALPSTVFERAIRETCFTAFREGVLADYSPDPGEACIEPRFADSAEQAQSRGFRVRLSGLPTGDFTRDFPIAYFNARASTVRATLYRDGKIPAEAKLSFSLGAYLEEEIFPGALNPPAFSLGPAEHSVSIRKLTRDEVADAEPWDSPVEGELPVVLSRALIEDGCDEALRHPNQEVGGFLLGHVCQDPRSADVFLLVTGLVSGDGTTEATSASVTFTAASFAKAREMIGLRAHRGAPPEIVVGWYHSHPFRFCDQCPMPTPPECVQKVLFFSADDVQLMESTFDQPFMVGLLAGIEPKLEIALGHAPVRLYGWRHGELLPRGFHVWDH